MVRNPVFFCLARATVLLLKNEFHATRHNFVFISFIDTSYLLCKSWHIQDLLPFLRKTTIIFLTLRKYYCIHQGSPLLLKLLVAFFIFSSCVVATKVSSHVSKPAAVLDLRVLLPLSWARFILALNFGKLISSKSWQLLLTVLDVFWTSYVRSIYVMCLQGSVGFWTWIWPRRHCRLG